MTDKQINVLGISFFVIMILFVIKNMLVKTEFPDIFYLILLIYLFIKYIRVIKHI